MHVDPKEFELPDTLLVSDIENQVFQSIAVRVLTQIQDISMQEGGLIDDFFGREDVSRLKGIIVEQDHRSHSVNFRIEINVAYGVSLPLKAEEIQNRILEEVTRLTGLHVGSVHVVFKNMIEENRPLSTTVAPRQPDAFADDQDDYSDDF